MLSGLCCFFFQYKFNFDIIKVGNFIARLKKTIGKQTVIIQYRKGLMFGKPCLLLFLSCFRERKSFVKYLNLSKMNAGNSCQEVLKVFHR